MARHGTHPWVVLVVLALLTLGSSVHGDARSRATRTTDIATGATAHGHGRSRTGPTS